jgi:hypothetical protein
MLNNKAVAAGPAIGVTSFNLECSRNDVIATTAARRKDTVKLVPCALRGMPV